MVVVMWWECACARRPRQGGAELEKVTGWKSRRPTTPPTNDIDHGRAGGLLTACNAPHPVARLVHRPLPLALGSAGPDVNHGRGSMEPHLPSCGDALSHTNMNAVSHHRIGAGEPGTDCLIKSVGDPATGACCSSAASSSNLGAAEGRRKRTDQRGLFAGARPSPPHDAPSSRTRILSPLRQQPQAAGTTHSLPRSASRTM